MLSDEIRKKLQDIVRGNVLTGQNDCCTTIRNLLCKSYGSNPTVKKEFESRFIIKKEQAGYLSDFAESTNLLLSALPDGTQYLTRGGEAEIYLAEDHKHVIKVNDAIYYATWTEYFNSLVLHNLLFPHTGYDIIGFKFNKKFELCLVLSQPFIEGEQAELSDICEYLVFNGFKRTIRQDYFNEEFGLILEDMHDENVIAKDDALFFIDTVFYIMEKK